MVLLFLIIYKIPGMVSKEPRGPDPTNTACAVYTIVEKEMFDAWIFDGGFLSSEKCFGVSVKVDRR